MAFLTVAGTQIGVARDRVRADVDEVGDSGRAFDGTWRQNVRNRVQRWEGETHPLTRDDATSQYNALNASTQPQTVAGDMVSSSGGSVSAFTRAVRWEPILSGSTHRVVISWELQVSS